MVLNGQKTFISNGINCDLVVVAARDPAVEDPHAGIDLYVVEAGTPGFVKGKKIPKIGLHSQDTAEMFFEDCRIPVANRLGMKGRGFLMIMDKLAPERLVVAIIAVASAERMLEWTLDYCKERKVFGSRSPSSSTPSSPWWSWPPRCGSAGRSSTSSWPTHGGR